MSNGKCSVLFLLLVLQLLLHFLYSISFSFFPLNFVATLLLAQRFLTSRPYLPPILCSRAINRNIIQISLWLHNSSHYIERHSALQVALEGIAQLGGVLGGSHCQLQTATKYTGQDCCGHLNCDILH